ncbi:MAG: helix-turn-helix transcriptional regulator [Alphaproteobacteria bacterium]|nr:helix-turn-helix transcriptional regulator [Alphaproteobacteria bacterium]
MLSRSRLLEEVSLAGNSGDVADGLALIVDYAGALNYLLARWDAYSEGSLEFAISANWPFNLVRFLGTTLVRAQLKITEIERCMSAMQPTFVACPDSVVMPSGLSRQLCVIPFDIGPARMALLLCFEEGMIFSENRLKDVAPICAYHLACFGDDIFGINKRQDLTEREVECLSWIAEGKTSDEISLIIGISRNTVNNYITSIMKKTSTKTRSEAIAHAVRNNLI